MFKSWLFLVCLLVLSSFAYSADKITYNEDGSVSIEGEYTEAQRAADKIAYLERLKKSEDLVNAEIKRKHELDIEVAKFKNAIMLERASAPKINVNAYLSSRSTNVANNGTIRTQKEIK